MRTRKKNNGWPCRGAALALSLTVIGALLVGCETQTSRVRTVELPGVDRDTDSGNPVRALVEAPADLHDLSGFLLRYQVEYKTYPPTLAALRDVGIMPAAGYDGLPQYAYAADGLGTLAGGGRIMVVDRAIRIADHVWCVIEIDNSVSHTAALDVRLVPLPQLQAAAKRR